MPSIIQRICRMAEVRPVPSAVERLTERLIDLSKTMPKFGVCQLSFDLSGDDILPYRIALKDLGEINVADWREAMALAIQHIEANALHQEAGKGNC